MTLRASGFMARVLSTLLPAADGTYNLGSASFRFLNGFFAGYITTGSYTVAGLPVASTAGPGARAWVSDSSLTFASANFGATVTGGGANGVPVVSDGTNWKIG